MSLFYRGSDIIESSALHLDALGPQSLLASASMGGSDAPADVTSSKERDEDHQKSTAEAQETLAEDHIEAESDDDTASSSEEDEEPRLKYSRLSIPQDVLVKDQISAFAVSEKLLVRRIGFIRALWELTLMCIGRSGFGHSNGLCYPIGPARKDH